MSTSEIRVLIVEDDVKIAKLTSEYLVASGIEVQIEHRGDTGLKRALATNYDLILLDLMLPHMDGNITVTNVR